MTEESEFWGHFAHLVQSQCLQEIHISRSKSIYLYFCFRSNSELAQLKAEMEEDYNARLADNEKEMEEMKKTFEEKLKEAQLGGVS